MAVVQGADLADVIIDAGESAKSLHRPGMSRLLALVDEGAVDTVIIAKLDRLTRSADYGVLCPFRYSFPPLAHMLYDHGLLSTRAEPLQRHQPPCMYDSMSVSDHPESLLQVVLLPYESRSLKCSSKSEMSVR